MLKKIYLLLAALLITGCATHQDNNDQTIGFRHFVRDFFADADFQKAHTRFPLEVVSYQYGDTSAEASLVTSHTSEAEWDYLPGPDFYQCETDCFDIVIYDNFAKQHDNSDERVLSFEGVNNGINSSLYFKHVDGTWLLVKYEQLDN